MDKLKVLANENPLPKEFDCTKCHDKCGALCCSNVPLPPGLIKRNAHRIQRKVIEWKKFGDALVGITESGRCPFLGLDLKCAVYKWRPPICRLYGTEIDHRMTCHFMDKKGNVRERVMEANFPTDNYLEKYL